MAAAVAVVAVIAGRIFRRPALTHGLWLLVLIKLITPPLLFVPMPFFTTPAADAEDQGHEATLLAESEMPPIRDPVPAEELLVLPPFIEDDAPPVQEVVPPDPPPAQAGAPPPPTAPVRTVDWFLVGAGIWLCGAIGWLFLASLRLRRFQRLLCQARPAPAALPNEVHP